MTKHVSVDEAGARLAELVDSVCRWSEPVFFERDGQPVAVMINPEHYRLFQEQVKERFFETVEKIQRLNEDEDPDEVLRFVTEVVDEVRQELYDRKQRGEAGSGDH